ncbi:hypothetical protein IM792_09435 [Mucilaginibacter sp. JRF]|uniref:hypothetical protein n=1 Tax=Mucilaginibacter sp. JRF TaxID=2780088 RepID=UPI001882E55A|nr:hypothetical protein [Mucilaginibacter sp. JRF]MBE9584666.1 hypothetical protein [Mucilaginibacter sp. JRF]
MHHEIHIYLGSGRIGKLSRYKFPVGEKHSFLLYLKAAINTDLDLTDAEKAVANYGLYEIEFSKFGKISPDRVNDDETRDNYNNAMATGSTLIVYSDPI